jgi:hypothetical protein
MNCWRRHANWRQKTPERVSDPLKKVYTRLLVIIINDHYYYYPDCHKGMLVEDELLGVAREMVAEDAGKGEKRMVHDRWWTSTECEAVVVSIQWHGLMMTKRQPSQSKGCAPFDGRLMQQAPPGRVPRSPRFTPRVVVAAPAAKEDTDSDDDADDDHNDQVTSTDSLPEPTIRSADGSVWHTWYQGLVWVAGDW